MKIVDILEKEVFSGSEMETPEVRSAEQYVDKLPSDSAVLEQVAAELTQLNADEVSRFDSWTAKGSAMLGASGLLLALAPLGFTLIAPGMSPHSWSHFWCWFAMVVVFLLSLGLFFLATWNSLVSLRARPLCRLDEDGWISGTSKTPKEMQRDLAADKLVTYKNNVDIANLKGTKVNEAWRYFFLGCLAQAVFIAAALILRTYWSG
ncbi:MAG: hypothetical protein ISS31_02230 [Kiritimatiellae bacterium]|nr:hypothetical protein [Kiritimatiellia bacterium]